MELTPRNCPLCDTASQDVYCESSIDPSRLDEFAFASRKYPELMHHRMVRCGVCGLVYVSPAPSALNLKQEYEQASFDSSEEAACAAKTYNAYLPPMSPGKALDIGPGGGEFLAQLLKRQFKVEGIEPSGAAIATATPEVRGFIRQGIFDPKDYKPESYALVSCFQTLEHVHDPLFVSRGAYNLLQKDGVFFTVSHNIQGVVNRLLGMKSPIFDIEHMQLFSPQSITVLMKNTGFRDVRVFPIWNRYPLHYWVKLLPLPKPFKTRIISGLKTLKIARLPIPMAVGNMGVIAIK